LFDGRPGRVASWLIPALLLFIGIAIRVNNAFQYTLLWGFDAKFNWQYIRMLFFDWSLPGPDAGWSTHHPPLFFYLSAAFARAFSWLGRDGMVISLRLLISLAGLLMVALVVAYVRRRDPAHPQRAILAGALVLFLPVHIYMSAMLTEEILASTLISLVLVGLAWHPPETRAPRDAYRWAAVIGLLAGLALLTKLTGLLAMLAVGGAYLADGWRRDDLRRAIACTAIVGVVTMAVGGWYYARNYIGWGYIYPHGLEIHKIMFDMPPGERHIADFFRFPLAVWRDPQALDPDLLRSVWGTTYVSAWFDAYRHFLPTHNVNVTRAGSVILSLALLPTVAFLVGAGRGLRRAVRDASWPDTIFILIIALTLAGYCRFAWKNPWFVVTKASYLLSLSVPFAYYASEVLTDWAHARGWRGAVVWGVLVCLAVAIACAFTFSDLFWSMDPMKKPGVVW